MAGDPNRIIEMPRDQFRRVVGAVQATTLNAKYMVSACASQMRRLGLDDKPDKTMAFSKKMPNPANSNLGSVVEWMNRVNADDENAVTQIRVLFGTAAAQLG